MDKKRKGNKGKYRAKNKQKKKQKNSEFEPYTSSVKNP